MAWLAIVNYEQWALPWKYWSGHRDLSDTLILTGFAPIPGLPPMLLLIIEMVSPDVL